MDAGGLVFDFEPLRTASGLSRRGREGDCGRGGGVARHAVDAVAAITSPRDHRDAVVMLTRASTRRRRDAVVPIKNESFNNAGGRARTYKT